MRFEHIYHTGLVVSDMERSLRFYRDVLGFQVERDAVVEGDFISSLLGLPGVRLRLAFLAPPGGGPSVELLQFLHPTGEADGPRALNAVGACHIGIIVEDLEALYRALRRRGVEFLGPPAERPGARHPWARKACFLRDPDGYWIELVERESPPTG